MGHFENCLSRPQEEIHKLPVCEQRAAVPQSLEGSQYPWNLLWEPALLISHCVETAAETPMLARKTEWDILPVR